MEAMRPVLVMEVGMNGHRSTGRQVGGPGAIQKQCARAAADALMVDLHPWRLACGSIKSSQLAFCRNGKGHSRGTKE